MLMEGRRGVSGEEGEGRLVVVGPTKGEAGRANEGAKGEGGARPLVGRGARGRAGEEVEEAEGVPGVEGAQGSPWSSWTWVIVSSSKGENVSNANKESDARGKDGTDEVEELSVVVDAESSDDAPVPDSPEHLAFHRHLSADFGHPVPFLASSSVGDPRVGGHLAREDELDRHLLAARVIGRNAHEAVPSRAEGRDERVSRLEERVEIVSVEERD